MLHRYRQAEQTSVKAVRAGNSVSLRVSCNNKIPIVIPFIILLKIILRSADGEDGDQKFIDVRMRAVGRKIIILSGKGGKTIDILSLVKPTKFFT